LQQEAAKAGLAALRFPLAFENPVTISQQHYLCRADPKILSNLDI
jgi:hypothetical protein